MPVRVVKSKHAYIIRLPALYELCEKKNPDEPNRFRLNSRGEKIERLPEVVLPKSHYYEKERARGLCNYAVLSEAQQARILEDNAIRGMFVPHQVQTGPKSVAEGGMWKWDQEYELLPEGVTTIPEHALPPEQRKDHERIRLQQENAALRAKLRRSGVDPNAPEPGAPVPLPPTDEIDPTAIDVSLEAPIQQIYKPRSLDELATPPSSARGKKRARREARRIGRGISGHMVPSPAAMLQGEPLITSPGNPNVIADPLGDLEARTKDIGTDVLGGLSRAREHPFGLH